MAATQSAPGKARFLIHAKDDGAPLRDFLASIAGDSDIAVVDTIGPRDLPHTAVLELSPEKALALAQYFRSSSSFSKQLTIEPDRPLSLFDD